MDIESLKPTIVLVHGALEDASIWHGAAVATLSLQGGRTNRWPLRPNIGPGPQARFDGAATEPVSNKN
jgi:hypothetical protein